MNITVISSDLDRLRKYRKLIRRAGNHQVSLEVNFCKALTAFSRDQSRLILIDAKDGTVHMRAALAYLSGMRFHKSNATITLAIVANTDTYRPIASYWNVDHYIRPDEVVHLINALSTRVER